MKTRLKEIALGTMFVFNGTVFVKKPCSFPGHFCAVPWTASTDKLASGLLLGKDTFVELVEVEPEITK